MRKNLKKLDPKKVYIFTGVYTENAYSTRACILYINVYTDSGEYLGMVNHNNVAIKPFRAFANKNRMKLTNGQKVRFTGTVKQYQRANCSKDFGIIVKNVKEIIQKG